MPKNGIQELKLVNPNCQPVNQNQQMSNCGFQND